MEDLCIEKTAINDQLSGKTCEQYFQAEIFSDKENGVNISIH